MIFAICILENRPVRIMDSGKPFDSIPDDLLIKILSKLPAKSIAKCRCVSKLWKSSALMRSGFHRDDFTDLFLTRRRSKARRRRLLIGVLQLEAGEWSFYSTPQPQNPSEKSSSLVADFHINFSKGISKYNCSYTSGLIYFHKMCIPREDEDVKHVICNPLTGQYMILPQLRGGSYSYLGFDPVDKEFKLLLMNTRDYIASKDTDQYILTIGTGRRELRWRKIQCPFTHEPLWERVCINGVLYYLTHHATNGRFYAIVCFDVRSEKFKLVTYGYDRRFNNLINYKGKLCGIYLDYAYGGGFPVKLSMKVLEKREWSSYVYSLSADQSEVVNVERNLSVVGVTASGDIVLSTNSASNPFYVFYFNPEMNTLQTVEMQGVGDNCDWRYAFVQDYVEDISVTDAMQLKSTTPLQLGQNIVPERPKPQQRGGTSLDLSKSSQSVQKKEQIIVSERLEPQRRRHMSPDLSKSFQSVKSKEPNKYELSADL
ncbi:PREDICTED: putative F-box protein At1g30930 [Camelina sativa]|uniref:F-box protein At1g30930 n=1 Tax=Camelina sativa TaxID=90675 RepID=A0ABM0YIP4_CAMSA|nr:PREDICTED: putative F-box protein At1g30930 [Camelina sativa]